ncbi:MAG: hypothetical protein CME65_10590 [Halobacteriovoraceae bacterium]|nr:hypothetical protein [Halobacteriovoraceae bacterium]|tara:strand:+ start:5520 stop:6707 length:1188 start_codon:yes stop_codon:yes gene_type:complete
MHVSNNPLPSQIEAPTSKSYANRALILAALTSEEVEIHQLPDSLDVEDMIDNLKKIGLKILREKRNITILNSFPACETETMGEYLDLEGSEGGTTVRFLTTLLSLGSKSYNLKLKAHMKNRPMDKQISLLSGMGVRITKLEEAVNIKGPLNQESSVVVDCSETTQFASSLILLSRFTSLDIKLENISFSSLYLEMTKSLVSNFKTPYRVPVDFSSLSYLVAYAILNQDLLIKNVGEIDSQQADAKLFDYLERLGGRLEFDGPDLKIFKSELKGRIEINVKDCLDLFPTLIYLAMFSQAQFVFKNLGPLEFKESNRKEEVFKLLDHFKVAYEYNRNLDILEVKESQPKLPTGEVKLPNDHRIVMSYTLMLKQLGGGKVPQSQSVRKSFGEFFNYFS